MKEQGTNSIRRTFERLHVAYGPQHWWPAESPFEIMVGAVLVQNTAWTNVERAIDRLRERGLLRPEALAALSASRLAPVIRPAGTYRVKAGRLLGLTRWYLEQGGHAGLEEWGTPLLRRSLLDVHGVGPETADVILCYAFHRPVFPVDAYARRLYRRLGCIDGGEDYEDLRGLTEIALGRDPGRLGEWHALAVQHGKAVCRPRPRCDACALARHCPRAGLSPQAG